MTRTHFRRIALASTVAILLGFALFFGEGARGSSNADGAAFALLVFAAAFLGLIGW